MKIQLLFCCGFFLLTCTNETSDTHPKKNTQKDTVYIATENINKSENTSEYILIFEQGTKQYEIYKEKDRDHNTEFYFLSSYKTEDIKLDQYHFYDLPTGRAKDIIHNKISNKFYLTEWYDNHASGDSLLMETVNFSSNTVRIKSLDPTYPDYQVKLLKLWDPNFKNAKEISRSNDLYTKLQGVWAENKTDNAIFMIKKDTIIYTENLSNPFKFVLISDTLKYKYPEGTVSLLILKATGDSLIIKEEGEITRLYNRKKSRSG
jgi:hypothetical protein